MNLNDMRIATRLILGFGGLASLIILMGVIALLRANTVEGLFYEVADDHYPKVATLNAVTSDLNVVARGIRNLVLLSEPEAEKRELAHIKDARASITAKLDQMSGTIRSEAGKTQLAKMSATRAAYSAQLDKVLALASSGKY